MLFIELSPEQALRKAFHDKRYVCLFLNKTKLVLGVMNLKKSRSNPLLKLSRDHIIYQTHCDLYNYLKRTFL